VEDQLARARLPGDSEKASVDIHLDLEGGRRSVGDTLVVLEADLTNSLNDTVYELVPGGGGGNGNGGGKGKPK